MGADGGGGADLRQAGEALGRSPAECDRALWALVGRTPAQAADRLNREGSPVPAPGARPAGVRRFISDLFGERR